MSHQVTCCVSLLPLQGIKQSFFFCSWFWFQLCKTPQTKHWLLPTILFEATFASKDLPSIIWTTYLLRERIKIFITVNFNIWLMVWFLDKGFVFVGFVLRLLIRCWSHCQKSNQLEKKLPGGGLNSWINFVFAMAGSFTRTSAEFFELHDRPNSSNMFEVRRHAYEEDKLNIRK